MTTPNVGGQWGVDEFMEIFRQGPTADQIKAIKPKGQHGGHFTIFGQTFYYGTHRSNSKRGRAKTERWRRDFMAEIQARAAG